jgi:hypothetical protein
MMDEVVKVVAIAFGAAALVIAIAAVLFLAGSERKNKE